MINSNYINENQNNIVVIDNDDEEMERENKKNVHFLIRIKSIARNKFKNIARNKLKVLQEISYFVVYNFNIQ